MECTNFVSMYTPSLRCCYTVRSIMLFAHWMFGLSGYSLLVATRRRASLGEGRDLLGHVISCVCDRRWIVTWWTMWSAIGVSREDTSRQHCPRRLAHYSITGSSFGCCLLPILHFWLKLPLRSSAFDDLYREWCWALAAIARRALPSHGSNVSGGGRRAEL